MRGFLLLSTLFILAACDPFMLVIKNKYPSGRVYVEMILFEDVENPACDANGYFTDNGKSLVPKKVFSLDATERGKPYMEDDEQYLYYTKIDVDLEGIDRVKGQYSASTPAAGCQRIRDDPEPTFWEYMGAKSFPRFKINKIRYSFVEPIGFFRLPKGKEYYVFHSGPNPFYIDRFDQPFHFMITDNQHHQYSKVKNNSWIVSSAGRKIFNVAETALEQPGIVITDKEDMEYGKTYAPDATRREAYRQNIYQPPANHFFGYLHQQESIMFFGQIVLKKPQVSNRFQQNPSSPPTARIFVYLNDYLVSKFDIGVVNDSLKREDPFGVFCDITTAIETVVPAKNEFHYKIECGSGGRRVI